LLLPRGEYASWYDADESHSTGRGSRGDLVPRAVRPHRAARAREARRRSALMAQMPLTAALAGIPGGLQSQGVWSGRRQLFVRCAGEAETATMYTADALAGEIKRAVTRSTFHSMSISGRDPLGNVEYLRAALKKADTALPVMLDGDGQRPEEVAGLRD